MKHDEKNKGTNFNLSLFFTIEFRVFFVIILFSLLAFINTLYFEEVPPILNRGIQPATFPKILLILITLLSSLVYYLSLKRPWDKKDTLEKPFFLTLLFLVLFFFIAIYLDFFLAISIFAFLVSFFWGERRIPYLVLVSLIFPLVVFIFFEMILGLRFPSGIITNFYYR